MRNKNKRKEKKVQARVPGDRIDRYQNPTDRRFEKSALGDRPDRR